MRQKITYLGLLVLVSMPFYAFADTLSTSAPSTELAQKPAECPVEKPKDPSEWDRSLSLGFSYTDGNSNTSFLNILGALSRDYKNNIWNFSASYSFGESDENSSDSRETTKNEALAAAGYKRIFSERWFGGLTGSYRYDEIADIDYRLLTNPTLGAFLLRDDELKFSLEAGPSYVFEKVGGIEDDYLAPRLADIFEWKFSPTSRLFQSAEVLFDATDSDNYIFNAEAGVESSLTTLLSLVLVVRDAYDNQPAEDRERNDLAVITSLKVNL